jgi:hypothetical protein
MAGAMAGVAAAVVGTMVVAAVVAGGVEQEAVLLAMLCLGGRLAVLRALSLWVSCSEGRLAHVYTTNTTRRIRVDVVFIKRHRNILEYSYFSNSTDQKNNNSQASNDRTTKWHSQNYNKSMPHPPS